MKAQILLSLASAIMIAVATALKTGNLFHGVLLGFITLQCAAVSLTMATPTLGIARLRALSSNPTLRNFARDASQSAIRRVARFLAPFVEVPDVTGQYKEYNSKHRYKRPKTLRVPGSPVTKLGFTTDDPLYNLKPHALDFPIPGADGMSDETLMFQAQYGVQLLSDASALDHEAETISAALTAAGAGTDSNFTSGSVDPIGLLDAAIHTVMKAAKNGAPVKVLFGATALLRTKNNTNVKGRFTQGVKNGIISPSLADIAAMLFGNPKCEVSLYVEDTAAEGINEAINFILDDEILVFASNDAPNTMDPSFMKTFVPMRGFMVPGNYRTEDDRDEVLKMDWSMQLKVTNTAAIVRLNAKAA